MLLQIEIFLHLILWLVIARIQNTALEALNVTGMAIFKVTRALFTAKPNALFRLDFPVTFISVDSLFLYEYTRTIICSGNPSSLLLVDVFLMGI